MKVATITFHWSVNYGAVLQAYALQKYLRTHGADAEVIDYVPRRVELSKFLLALKKKDRPFFRKRKLLRNFCKRELKLSKKTYRNNRALFQCADRYDAVICGSDQIWNESFTCGAEGKPTLSYYLNFVGKRTKRVAYAVSFGTQKLEQSTKDLILPQLEAFDRIAVREVSGQAILREMGVESVITVDPTMLLPKQAYEELFSAKTFAKAPKVFSYILHEGQTTAQKICHLAQRHFGQEVHDGGELHIDLRQWLYELAHSEFVVTNSFHGAVFAVLFHRSFALLPVEKSGMNDRIQTLMNALGLSGRIVTGEEEAQAILDREIDWDSVDARLKKLREFSEQYLNEVIQA